MKPGRTANKTLQVLRFLRGREDFFTIPQIGQELQITTNQASAALYNLRRTRCVDVVIEPDGTGWWFALPPEMDAHKRPSPEEVLDGIKRQRNWRREKKDKKEG